MALTSNLVFFEDPLLTSQAPWQNLGLCAALKPRSQGYGAGLWAPGPA